MCDDEAWHSQMLQATISVEFPIWDVFSLSSAGNFWVLLYSLGIKRWLGNPPSKRRYGKLPIAMFDERFFLMNDVSTNDPLKWVIWGICPKYKKHQIQSRHTVNNVDHRIPNVLVGKNWGPIPYPQASHMVP